MICTLHQIKQNETVRVFRTNGRRKGTYKILVGKETTGNSIYGRIIFRWLIKNGGGSGGGGHVLHWLRIATSGRLL